MTNGNLWHYNTLYLFYHISGIIMKTIAKLSILTALLGLGACSTVNLPELPSLSKKSTQSPLPAITVKSGTQSYSRFDAQTGNVAIDYVCNEGADITAKHQSSGQLTLLASIPSWNIPKQEIAFEPDTAKSNAKNGNRYTNKTNPKSLYVWQTKGTDGVLSVVIDRQTYQIQCKALATK